MRKLIFSVMIFLSFGTIQAQYYYNTYLEKINWPRHPKIHSGVIVTYGEKWVMLGGRSNGLHGYQTPSAFPADGIQDSIFVANPQDLSVKSVSISSIVDVNIREQLSSSNMLFYKDGNQLYIAGGYGYRAAFNDFVTFPYLCVINLDCLTNAVENGTDLNVCIQQVYDENMAVTGAHMRKMGDYLHLIFGHRFDGRYATTNTGVFTQTYTNAIRKFKVTFNPMPLITDFSEQVDTVNFHRRDYNLVEQVYSDGSVGYSAYSGVFQYGVDLPFENITDIRNDGTVLPVAGFEQKLSHYHSAVLPAYDSLSKTMITFFYGGMSRYKYNSALGLVEDTLVPFVKTISMVKRMNDGTIHEEPSTEMMPGFEGTNSEFIPLPNVPMHPGTQIIRFDKVAVQNNNPYHVGYLVGGIAGEDENVFLQNGVSDGSNAVYRVSIIRTIWGNEKLNIPYQFSIFPNPGRGLFTIKVSGNLATNAECIIYDSHGRTVKKRISLNLSNPENPEIQINLDDLKPGNYIMKLRSNQYATAQKLVIVH